MFNNNNTIIDYILQRLREVIREVVTEILCEHFKKDRYYSPSYDPNKILNLDEAAQYCGVCTRTLVTRVTKGKLKSGGTGRNYRFRVGDLDAFMFNEKI
jgi:excisionase family DNA binding protein